MASEPSPEIDYARVLQDLRDKRSVAAQERQRLDQEIQKLDAAITGISVLVSVPYRGELTAFPVSKDLAGLSLYKAAVAVLAQVGKPLTNFELVSGMRAGGRETKSDLAPLYTSLKEKGVRSEIIRIGSGKEGQWALKEWPGIDLV